MASPKTVIIACSVAFVLSAVVVVCLQSVPELDPVARLDGRFLPDSGDATLQSWANRSDSAPLPAQHPQPVTTRIKNTGTKQELVLEYEKRPQLPDAAPGPLVTLEPGQALHTESGTFRLVAFAVFDATVCPMRFLYATTARGEPLHEADLGQLGWGGAHSRPSSDSYLRGLVIFQKDRGILPTHSRVLSSADLHTAKSEATSIIFGSPLHYAAEFRLPLDPTSHPAIALDLYSKPVTAGRIQLATGATLDCGALGELRSLAFEDWECGNGESYRNENAHITQAYTGKPGGTIAILRIPDGVATERFVFNHPQPGSRLDNRSIQPHLPALFTQDKITEAEVITYRTAHRVVQKLPRVTHPEFTHIPDPLDWPIPDSLKTGDNSVTDVVRRMTGLRLDLRNLSGWNPDERMNDYEDCHTVRDMLRKMHRNAVLHNPTLEVDRTNGRIMANTPEPTWWERLRKFAAKFL